MRYKKMINSSVWNSIANRIF